MSLHELADLVGSQEPDVRRFLSEALAGFEDLSHAVSDAERRCAAAEARAFMDDGHRRRLEDLILLQEADITRLNGVIERVEALVAMGRWSAGMSELSGPVAILVDDLAAALAGAHG